METTTIKCSFVSKDVLGLSDLQSDLIREWSHISSIFQTLSMSDERKEVLTFVNNRESHHINPAVVRCSK